MKATFLPPKHLLQPILPLKCNGKLKFPLCYKCAVTKNNEECTCSDEEISFTQPYCTPEIETAINMDYKITEYHEVLHWKESEQYDPLTKEGGSFTSYINAFFEIETASKWISRIYSNK